MSTKCIIFLNQKGGVANYRGLKALIKTIDEIKEEELNPDLKIKGIVGTFYESNVILQRQVLEKIEALVYSLLGTLRKSTDITRNVVKGLPAIMAMPNSKVALEYQTIADKL